MVDHCCLDASKMGVAQNYSQGFFGCTVLGGLQGGSRRQYIASSLFESLQYQCVLSSKLNSCLGFIAELLLLFAFSRASTLCSITSNKSSAQSTRQQLLVGYIIQGAHCLDNYWHVHGGGSTL